jgi:hypothetical protein
MAKGFADADMRIDAAGEHARTIGARSIYMLSGGPLH